MVKTLLFSPNTFFKNERKKKVKKKRSVYAHVACIPAFEWVVNSKSVVLTVGRKWLAFRFKEAIEKRMDKLLIIVDHDKIMRIICKKKKKIL